MNKFGKGKGVFALIGSVVLVIGLFILYNFYIADGSGSQPLGIGLAVGGALILFFSFSKPKTVI